MTDTQSADNRRYYPAWYRLDGLDRYLLWWSGEAPNSDRVVVDEHGKAPAFRSVPELEAFAGSFGVLIEDPNPLMNDFDAVKAWLADPKPATVPCEVLLDLLNLGSDVAQSVGGNFTIYEPDLDVVYNKLFWGSNLPAMTPEGEHFTPTWSDEDIAILIDATTRAIGIFREQVVAV